jgi:hypothetical protein
MAGDRIGAMPRIDDGHGDSSTNQRIDPVDAVRASKTALIAYARPP